MARTEYNEIYTAFRERIEDGTYAFQELLPSRNTLVREFDCPRDTIRRTIGQLIPEGYVQNAHGRGVRIIYQPGQRQSEFILGGIESLKEAMVRDRKNYTTKVIRFAELTVDETIRRRTTFPMGTRIYYIQRMRCIEGEALIIDRNYFLRDVVQSLTPEIVERSTYEYTENDLGESIVTTKRRMTVEHASQIDEKYLDSKDYNCMAMANSMTYNKEGVMFEFTRSRHRSGRFVFYNLAHRIKQVS